MSDYLEAQPLYMFLHVPYNPMKHWSISSGWEIGETMDNTIQETVRAEIRFSPFFAISLDEVTTIDNSQWLAIHIYTYNNFSRKCHYLCVSKIEGISNAQNLIEIILANLLTFGGLESSEIASNLVFIGCDGAYVL